MPKAGPKTTNQYSDEFKATAVRLSHLPCVAVQDVAASLYIHPFMLSRWRKQIREGEIVAKKVELNKERLQIEHAILKKAIEFTSDPNRTSLPTSNTRKKRSR